MPTAPLPPPPAEPAPLRRVEIGEPVEVWTAAVRTPDDLRLRLRELRARRPANLTLVVRPPAGLSRAEWEGLLDLAAGAARRLILTAAPDVGPGAWARPAEVEPDPVRAVVGAMLSLRPGDAFAVLWAADGAAPSAESLIEQGARWRAAWEAPEDGEVHGLPPG